MSPQKNKKNIGQSKEKKSRKNPPRHAKFPILYTRICLDKNIYPRKLCKIAYKHKLHINCSNYILSSFHFATIYDSNLLPPPPNKQNIIYHLPIYLCIHLTNYGRAFKRRNIEVRGMQGFQGFPK